MTPTEMTLVQRCNAIMSRWNFNSSRRREWLIWAAKSQECPQCEQPPNKPCLHLGELRYKAREFVKVNNNPHQDRVDWQKLYDGLEKRGYTE